jgi:hypothetical protein
VKRATLNQSKTPKPAPGGGKPRPPARPKPVLPKCKAIYDYTAQDVDELSFQEGDIIDIVNECMYFYILFLEPYAKVLIVFTSKDFCCLQYMVA